MMYVLLFITVCAVTFSLYNAHQVTLLHQQLDYLEEKLTHTIEALDYVTQKLDVVRENLKYMKHEDEVDDTDWWKKQ